MITRLGKIGRLPQNVRDLLGAKIWDGVPGKEIAAWVNSLPEVQAVLARQFGNHPITEQNISHWKQNGHADWERQLQRRELVTNVGADAEELEAETAGRELSDRFASLVAVEVVKMAQVMLEQEPDLEKRWARLREVNKELSRLRRDDHRAVRALVERTGWQAQQDEAGKAAEVDPDREFRKQLCAGYHAKLQMGEMTEKFGGDEEGRYIAGLVLEVQNNLPPGMLAAGPAELKQWAERGAKRKEFRDKRNGIPEPAPKSAEKNGSKPEVAGDTKRAESDEETHEGNRQNAQGQNSNAGAQEGEDAGVPDSTLGGKIQPNPS